MKKSTITSFDRKVKKLRSDRMRRIKKKSTQKHNKHSDKDDSTLAVAKACGCAGVAVFPLYGRDFSGSCKCGNCNCKQHGRHPMKEATTDIKTIRGHWTKSPDDMIGVPLGSASGVIALVVDGAEGEKTLRAMKEKTK
jgi:hypothetical protein